MFSIDALRADLMRSYLHYDGDDNEGDGDDKEENGDNKESNGDDKDDDEGQARP